MSNRRIRRFRALRLFALFGLGCSFVFASATQETASVSEQTANKAAKVTVTSSGFTKEAASQPAPAGKAFFIRRLHAN